MLLAVNIYVGSKQFSLLQIGRSQFKIGPLFVGWEKSYGSKYISVMLFFHQIFSYKGQAAIYACPECGFQGHDNALEYHYQSGECHPDQEGEKIRPSSWKAARIKFLGREIK